MKQQDYWKRFEQTGAVNDYLHYVACADERQAALGDAVDYSRLWNRDELAASMAEEGTDERGPDGDRNGVIGYSDWRI